MNMIGQVGLLISFFLFSVLVSLPRWGNWQLRTELNKQSSVLTEKNRCAYEKSAASAWQSLSSSQYF